MDETIETIHPETLQESTPPVILDAWSQGSEYLAQYGWYLVSFGIAAAYGWTLVSPHFYQWRKKQAEKAYDAKYKKDPNISKARFQALEASRKKMQEEYEKKAAEWAEKMKEAEAKKREEELEKTQHVNVGRTLGGSTDSNKTKYKNDYLPLAGGGGTGYRPPRRSCCPSSGCG